MTVSGQLPIDRVREQEAKNQPKKDQAKQRFSEKQSKLEQAARTHDDDATNRALDSGEMPDNENEEKASDKQERAES